MSKRFRLVPVALAAWAAAIVATLAPDAASVVALTAWAAALVTLLSASLLHRRGAVVAVTVLAFAAAAASASHVSFAQPARAAVVSDAISGGRAVEVVATVVGKVERRATGELAMDAVAGTMTVGEDARAVDVGIVIRVAPEDVDGQLLDVGAVVEARGSVRPARPGDRAVLELSAGRGVRVVRAPEGALAVAADLRRGLTRAVQGLPEPAAGLVPGLAVGDTGGVTLELDAAMKESSLSHLTAVSGANCAIVVGLGFGLAALMGIGRRGRIACGLSALAGFVVLVTPEPSVVRAATMAAIAMVTLAVGRPGAGVSVLSLAVTVLLVCDPWLGLSLGFALSTVATASLLVCARPFTDGLARWMPRPLALALAVPLSAQLACGPLLVLIQPSVPLLGVVANLLAAPVAPIATVVGLLACLAAPIPWIASGLAAIAWLPAAWIAVTAETITRIPGDQLPWAEGWAGTAALAGIGVAVGTLIALPSGGGRLRRAARGVSAAALAVVVGATAGATALATVAGPLTVPAHWSVLACDVGQGDAILLRDADAVALVDTGPDPDALGACLARVGIDRVDLLVLTHFDLDHVGGVPALVGRVGTVLHGPVASADDERVVAGLESGGATPVPAHEGLRGTLGDAKWRVLWPRAHSPAFLSGNDASVVLDVRGGLLPASLFLGDLSAAPQASLAASATLDPPYGLVKVAHHGSADQDAGLYRLARPALALVTVGNGNDYGHPRDEILTILSGVGADVARTDRDGVVAISRSPGGLVVWREREETSAALDRVDSMATTSRRSPAASSRVAIPQVSWRSPQPAPIVLVSGPEDVCAERAIAGVRDYLRAEDPSLEVSDVRADDYLEGTLLSLTSPSLFGEPRLVRVSGVEKCSDSFLSEAISYLAQPQDGATVVLRHTSASVRGKKLLDAVRSGQGGGIEIPCPAVKRDSDRFDFAAGEFQAAKRRIAPSALRSLVSAFADDLTELAAACQQLIADVPGDIDDRVVERYYGGRVETSAFTVADTAIAGRYGDALVALRHALASGADPVPLVAAIASKLRTMARVAGSRESSGALAARLGLKDWQVDRARRDLTGWNEASLGLAIQAAARADAEVKGASRDPVFAVERLVTVIATRAPFGA